jgi:probable O-glycosylation ligase (exosortase A-associated)
MLSAALVLFTFLMISVGFRFPIFGLCMYIWVDLLPMDLLFPGALTEFARFALFSAVATAVGTLLFEKLSFQRRISVIFFLCLFLVWTGLTTLQAVFPDSAAIKLERLSKNYLMVILGILLINSRERVHLVMLTIVFSISVLATKGFLVTIMTGGGGQAVSGIVGSYLEERNYLVMAFIIQVWLSIYLWQYYAKEANDKYMSALLVGCIFIGTVSIVGTHSRAGMLATVASMTTFALYSKRKFSFVAIAIFIVGLTLMLAPDEWTARMGTVKQYSEDESASSRITTWLWAWEYANNNPIFGGGFTVFRLNLADASRAGYFDAHSMIFEVLAEHGFFGLTLFLIILGLTLLYCHSTWRKLKQNADTKPHELMAPICILAGAIGMFTAAIFGVLSSYLMCYLPLLMITGLRAVVFAQPKTT